MDRNGSFLANSADISSEPDAPAGVTIIVEYDLETANFDCVYTIDTIETENDSAWATLPERFTTPIDAAHSGMATMRVLLGGAALELDRWKP